MRRSVRYIYRERETEREWYMCVCVSEIIIRTNLDSFHGFQWKTSDKIILVNWIRASKPDSVVAHRAATLLFGRSTTV